MSFKLQDVVKDSAQKDSAQNALNVLLSDPAAVAVFEITPSGPSARNGIAHTIQGMFHKAGLDTPTAFNMGLRSVIDAVNNSPNLAASQRITRHFPKGNRPPRLYQSAFTAGMLPNEAFRTDWRKRYYLVLGPQA